MGESVLKGKVLPRLAVGWTYRPSCSGSGLRSAGFIAPPVRGSGLRFLFGGQGFAPLFGGQGFALRCPFLHSCVAPTAGSARVLVVREHPASGLPPVNRPNQPASAIAYHDRQKWQTRFCDHSVAFVLKLPPFRKTRVWFRDRSQAAPPRRPEVCVGAGPFEGEERRGVYDA